MHRCEVPNRKKDGDEYTCPGCNVKYRWSAKDQVWKWVSRRA